MPIKEIRITVIEDGGERTLRQEDKLRWFDLDGKPLTDNETLDQAADYIENAYKEASNDSND